MKKVANINDVAKLCGVSAMTVSRVLNHSTLVSDATKKKVLAACEKLGYIPNHAAKSLVRRETQMIGLVVPDIGNYYVDIIRQITGYLDKEGYSVLLCDFNNEKAKEIKYLNFLLEGRVDGIILFPNFTDKADYERIINRIPLVMSSRFVEGLDLSYVGTDNYLGSKRMMEYIIQKGYRRIGLIAGDPKVQSFGDRLRAYNDTLKENKIIPDEELIIFSNLSFKKGYQYAKDLIDKKVDCIFAMNDSCAMGVIKFCYDHGIEIPKKLGVAGYDNINLNELLPVSLTTVDYKGPLVGVTAAKILLEEMKDKTIKKRKVILAPELVIRDSI